MDAATDRIRIAGVHRQAEEYDQYASVQKRVVSLLDDLVAAYQIEVPEHALDIGCGTGAMLGALHRRFPRTGLCGLDLAFNMTKRTAQQLGSAALLVNGAAEQLPFREQKFDLVVSASTFQWVKHLDNSFEECRRVLKRGGLFCAAFFGGRTLWELQECYREAVTQHFGANDVRLTRLQSFRCQAEVEQMVSRAGFDQLKIASRMEMDFHPDVSELLHSIKAIGAAVANNNKAGGLGWRKIMNDMTSIYRLRFQHNGMKTQDDNCSVISFIILATPGHRPYCCLQQRHNRLN